MARDIAIEKIEKFSGQGGPVAITSERGLVKAFTGDTIITLGDGSRHVIAKELASLLFPDLDEGFSVKKEESTSEEDSAAEDSTKGDSGSTDIDDL